MAKSRAQKETLLKSYQEKLANSNGYIAVDIKGVDTLTITELRKKLKEMDSNINVVKNKVLQIALRDGNMPTQAVDFAEQTAIIPYVNDPTQPAKLIKELQKETEKFAARYGVIDGTYLDSQKVMELADIPSREVLLAKLLGSLNAPLSGFANVISGNVRGFVRALQQISEQIS